jgi:hypothetical protein
VTGRHGSGRGAVSWLTAQALVFGAMAALLGIVANALFLDAYGSAWLPATYVAIGVAGVIVSGAIARTAQRFDLLGIAVSVLAAAAVGLGGAWLVAAGGGAPWVSAALLVLFPILIQLGFVFIGGQAGRVLDIAGIKSSFPRIMAGFPVGAVLGSLLGGQLVSSLGRAEDLLLAAAIAQGAFTALVWITGRRYAADLRRHEPGLATERRGPADDDRTGPPKQRTIFATRFVALILGYQVLSALGSQLADFLVFDRASAQYQEAAELARFLATYTAVMNAVAIAFLVVLAGPLLRRFGLRLGIAANPLVVTVFAVGMVAANAIAGGASVALLAIVSAARIADIALTDGTTRTSINAIYQVLPERDRLSVQTAVEGIGVPVAIGISGVLILILNTLPFALIATIAVTVLVCAIWTWAAVLLYRAYGPALVHALQRRPLLAPIANLDLTAEDEAIALQLLSSPDARATRLGIDLLTATTAPGLAGELTGLTHDPRPEIRLAALAALAGAGDESAEVRLPAEVSAAAGSQSPAIRLQAARALQAMGSGDRADFAALLEDPDMAVQIAALDSVGSGDAFAVVPVIAALRDPRSAGAAAGAVGRLGDAIVPAMAERLETAGSPISTLVIRLVRATAGASQARDEVLRRYVGHRNRELALAVVERLVAFEPASDATAAILDEVLIEDVRHATSILAALAAVDSAKAGGQQVTDAPLRRALGDELDLVRATVRANRLARQGSARLGPVMVELTADGRVGAGGSGDAGASGSAGGLRGALALEALDVVLGPEGSKSIVALLHPVLSIPERLSRLPTELADDGPSDLVGFLRDIVEDPRERWRSTWLRACAIHAAKARGLLEMMDVGAARTIGDSIIDEALRGAVATSG